MTFASRVFMSQFCLLLVLLPLIAGYRIPQQSRKRSIDVHHVVAKGPGSAALRGKTFGIALKAAQEAQAASDAQMPAAENAAQLVKTQLADKACAAAKAANAALARKEAIVAQLDMEVRESELTVRNEATYLQTAQANCESAAQASKQAALQLKSLKEAMVSAKLNVENSEQTSNGVDQELLLKQQLVEAAKNHVELLLKQLENAKTDYETTKKAAERACSAAQQAKTQAARQRRMAEVLRKLKRRNIIK